MTTPGDDDLRDLRPSLDEFARASSPSRAEIVALERRVLTQALAKRPRAERPAMALAAALALCAAALWPRDDVHQDAYGITREPGRGRVSAQAGLDEPLPAPPPDDAAEPARDAPGPADDHHDPPSTARRPTPQHPLSRPRPPASAAPAASSPTLPAPAAQPTPAAPTPAPLVDAGRRHLTRIDALVASAERTLASAASPERGCIEAPLAQLRTARSTALTALRQLEQTPAEADTAYDTLALVMLARQRAERLSTDIAACSLVHR